MMNESLEGSVGCFTNYVDQNFKPADVRASPGKSPPTVSSIGELDEFLKLADRKKVKKLLRTCTWSPSHDIRRGLWWKLCCAGHGGQFQIHPETHYNEMAREVFGEGDADSFVRLPSFVDTCHLESYYLSEAGIFAAKKLLSVIAHERPDIVFCPLLFGLTCLLLHYLDEQGTYDCINHIISSKEKYLTQTKTAHEASTLVLKELTRKYAKPSFQSMVKRTPDVELVLENSSWWIMKDLPFSYTIRVLDCFLYEGPKVLYRIALAILILYHKQTVKASPRSGSSGDVAKEIQQFCENIPVSCDKLLKAAFGIRGLSRSEMRKLILRKEIYVQSKHNVALLQGTMPTSPSAGSLSLLVTRDPGSHVIAKRDWRDIYSWLPKRFTLKQPKLIFSTSEHGTSLNTFYSRVEGYEPTFIAIKTTQQETFGAYCSVDWTERKSGRHSLQYFGTGESFVCTLHPTRVKYSWIGISLKEDTPHAGHLFMSGDAKQISIGGGNGTAILLDENLLKGVTQHCDTFDNRPLANGGMFTITVLEVFGFE